MNEQRRQKLEELQTSLAIVEEGLQEVCKEEQVALDRCRHSSRNNPQIQHMQGNVKCLKEAIENIAEAMTAIDGSMMTQAEVQQNVRKRSIR